jgi:hypothetical protein
MESEKKVVAVSLEKPMKKVKIEKEKQKRQITHEKKWTFGEPELNPQNQWNLIQQIHEKNIQSEQKRHCEILLQQINGKINGYKSQDIDKKIFDEPHFIEIDKIIELLITCRNKCYYCQEAVQVLYEFVREPKQWTLDRLDNDFGHNADNVVISCLRCNLRRKTMHSDRYVFTKQLVITKSGGGSC